MTRRKQNDHKPSGDFRHAPFKALKGFAATGRPSTPAAPSPAASGATEDDETLFQRATAGAKPLAGPARSDPSEEPRPSATSGKDEAPEEQAFLEAMHTLGAASFGAAPEDDEGTAAAGTRSPSSRMRQLKRGTLRIGAELDLHGFVKDEALRRLEHFIASASARGLDAALVITGKGINSPDGPVLPAAVAAWLRGPGLRYVPEFHPAPRERGGSGAFVVFLRRR